MNIKNKDDVKGKAIFIRVTERRKAEMSAFARQKGYKLSEWIRALIDREMGL